MYVFPSMLNPSQTNENKSKCLKLNFVSRTLYSLSVISVCVWGEEGGRLSVGPVDAAASLTVEPGRQLPGKCCYAINGRPANFEISQKKKIYII